jgi:mannose-binding lectin 2
MSLAVLAAASAVVASSLVSPASAFTLLPAHSFVPPFNTFDREGMRTVPNWSFGGNGLSVNENFVRLTPDRASKRGYLWNDEANSLDEWSATIRFRVSGQGKKLFGDGLGVFFTRHDGYRDGNLHGFTDTFVGFGVIFDTFVNSEPGHVHKDILVVSSDGTSSKAAPHGGSNDPNPSGCDGDFSEFRYWEGRDDFSVTNHSAVRITFKRNSVSVYIDARANGQWSTCVADVPVNAPFDWYKQGAYLGVIATTGDLADNHDVLSVQVGPEDEEAENPFQAKTDFNIDFGSTSTGNAEVDAAVRTMINTGITTLHDRLAVTDREFWPASEKSVWEI